MNQFALKATQNEEVQLNKLSPLNRQKTSKGGTSMENHAPCFALLYIYIDCLLPKTI